MRGRKQKRRTVHDVAKAAGVSIATVSYVLNDRGSVSEDVRRKVRRAARQVGYSQNRAARAMKTGRTNTVGLVIPSIVNPFFSMLAQAVLQQSAFRDYQVFIVVTEHSQKKETRAMEGLIEQGVDGIILFPVGDSIDGAASQFDIPVVVVDRNSAQLDVVQAEYFEGGRLLANHLMGLGHRNFGILEGPQRLTSARARSQGFIDALGKDCRVVWREEHPFAMSLTQASQDRLAGRDVTAVICGNDLIAIATIAHLHSVKRAVPGEVSVVGFDDIQFATLVNPALTTVRLPISGMGVEAVDLLVERMTVDGVDEPRKRIVLDVELVKRESSGPVASPGR